MHNKHNNSDGRPTMMTVREVADFFRCHTSTVYRLLNSGELPGIKLGGGWRFRREALEEYLHRNEGRIR